MSQLIINLLKKRKKLEIIAQRKPVTEALQEYIQRRKQLRIVDLFGSIDYEPDYDYIDQRNKK